MTRAHFGRLAALLVLVGLAGCSRFHPVQGQLVWMDGQPAKELAGSYVFFESSEHRTISRSLIGEDATFRLSTEKLDDGVPRGLHRVYVVERRTGGGESGKTLSRVCMDQRFADPNTSGLEVTVPPNGPVVLKVARARTK